MKRSNEKLRNHDAQPIIPPDLRKKPRRPVNSDIKRTLVMQDKSKLIVVKLIHTIVWAILATSIAAIPICAFKGWLWLAWGLIGFVLIEVIHRL